MNSKQKNTEKSNDIHAIPGEIESRIGYSVKFDSDTFARTKQKKSGWLFHRKDYHEDGSVSDTYGIELTREVFLSIGGIELPVNPVPDTSNVREESTLNGS